MPFILSTPHHSMSWAAGGSSQSAPPQLPTKQQQYEAGLNHIQQSISAAQQQLAQLQKDYQTMLAEYEGLSAKE